VCRLADGYAAVTSSQNPGTGTLAVNTVGAACLAHRGIERSGVLGARVRLPTKGAALMPAAQEPESSSPSVCQSQNPGRERAIIVPLAPLLVGTAWLGV
jgi:hypothetical protein